LRAEDALIPGAELLGLGEPVVEDQVRKLRRGAAGEADEPLGMPLEDLLVDPRLVIETLQEGLGGQPHQVAYALAGPRQKRQVKGMLLPGHPPAGAVG